MRQQDSYQLGATYEDQITGFQGVAVALCRYITGCDQLELIPRVDDDGREQKGAWFDITRLTQLSTSIINIDENEPKTLVEIKQVGGPADHPNETSHPPQ